MKTDKKRLSLVGVIFSAAMLVFAIAAVVTIIFGWFAVSNRPYSENLFLQIKDEVIEAGLIYNGSPYVGEALILQSAVPGNSWDFEVVIREVSSENIRISFFGIKGIFEYEDADGTMKTQNMADIIGVQYPAETGAVVPLSGLLNGTIASLPVKQGDSIKFKMLFLVDAPAGVDINIYQGKTLEILKLRVEAA